MIDWEKEYEEWEKACAKAKKEMESSERQYPPLEAVFAIVASSPRVVDLSLEGFEPDADHLARELFREYEKDLCLEPVDD